MELMFQMRKEREAITKLGPKARNLWLLGGRVQVPECGILGSYLWLTQEVVLHVLSAFVCVCVCVCVSQACEKVHCQTSQQILVRPGRCGMHMRQ